MTPKEMLESHHAVVDLAYERGADIMVPLFSGGHDSFSAVFAASLHPRFLGEVHHIDTGIGAKITRAFVEGVCKEQGWVLNVYKSESTYEHFVRNSGFPGPAHHQWAYARLKERCICQIMKRYGKKINIALITGCRSQESTRRMGNTAPLKIGEQTKRGIVNKRRYWTAPCHNWSDADQMAFMDYYDLPRNPLKMTPIGMSGECFCGAFARPNEIALIRRYAPDVAEEIDRLTMIAEQCGKPSIWGVRPKRDKGILPLFTGPLCNSCDARAMAAGITVVQCDLRD